MSDDGIDELTEADYAAAREAYWTGTTAEAEEADRKEFEALCAKARAKVEQAMVSACQKDPSIAALRAHEWIYTESLTVMAIGPDDIVICPHSMMEMSLAQIEVLLRHEWGHVARQHHEREKTFLAEINDPDNAKIWKAAFNCGCDMEINSDLRADMIAANMETEGYLPGYGSCTAFPVGLKAEEYARLVMADADLLHAMEWQALRVMKPKSDLPF
jgi:hypothetical protein